MSLNASEPYLMARSGGFRGASKEEKVQGLLIVRRKGGVLDGTPAVRPRQSVSPSVKIRRPPVFYG